MIEVSHNHSVPMYLWVLHVLGVFSMPKMVIKKKTH